MGKSEYNQFVENFERLSPYEVEHFSKILFAEFARFADTLVSSHGLPTAIQLREIITNAMKHAHIEIAERKIEEARLRYDMVRNHIFIETTTDRNE